MKEYMATPARPVALAQADMSYQSPFPEIQKPQQQQPVGMAEGGDVSAPDIGDAPAREDLARMFANQEMVAGMGDMTTAGVGRNFDVGGGNLNIGAALTSMTRDEKQELAKNLMAAYTHNIGNATVGMNVNKPLDIPADVYQAALMGSMPIGQGRAMISAQGTRVNGQDYPVNQMIGYEHPVGPGQLSFNASQMKDFPESRQYQLQYRMPIGRADGGDVAPPVTEEDPLRNLPPASPQDTTAMDKYRLALWAEKNNPDMLTTNNNELAALLMRGRRDSRTYDDRSEEEPRLEQRRNVSPYNSPEEFQNMPGDNIFGMRREMPRPESFDYPRLGRGDDYRRPEQEARQKRDEITRQAMELGFPFRGTYYANGGVVHRAGGSPDTGERMTPQQIEQLAADQVALNTYQPPTARPSTGMNRNITYRNGEDTAAVMQGAANLPYDLLGIPRDIPNMIMTPFGYGVEKPVMGSDWLKEQATAAGIRPPPSTNPTLRAFHNVGEVSAGLVNPGPIAAKVGQTAEKAIATGGKTVAKEMLRGLEGQGVLAPISPQDSIMYAVKPKGGAFTGTREYEYPRPGTEGRVAFEDSVTSLIKSGELLPDLRTDLPIPMQSRKALDGWVEDKIGSYIRKDMATKNDPFVKAVDEGKKLHLLEDLGDIKPMSGLARRRDREGFPAWGSAKTPLGRKLEKQIDSSMWSEDIGDVNAYNMHPLMEGFRDTNPNMPIYTPGSQLANRMQFPKMIEGMEDMLAGRKYTAYGDISVPIPQEYQLTPEKLQGMSPVQASEKVALFNQWRDGERQIQAAQYLDKHGNVYKKYDNGRKWIAMDDLAQEPKQSELVQQAGCLGGWCTKDESFALSNGSGDNRLHLLFDEKATPKVQLTVTTVQPNTSDFITHMDDAQYNAMLGKYGERIRNYTAYDPFIESTPEYNQWLSTQGPKQERITEIQGQFGRNNIADDPNSGKFLKEVQDFVKSKDWGTVANLDGINMIDLDDYLPTLSRGLNPEQTNQLSDFMKSLNGGSRYADKQEGANILKEASLRVFRPLSPPKHATGGMVERQASTARYI